MAAVPWVNLGASSRAEPSRAHSLFSGGEASTNTEARAHAQVSVGRPTSGGATTLPDVPVARGRWLWAATLVVTLVAGGGLWLSRASHDVQDLSLMKRRPLDATSAPAAIHMSLTTPAPVAAPALGAPTVGGSKENFPGPLPGVHPPTKPVVSARGQRKRSAVGEHSPPQKPSTFVKRGTATPSVWDPDSPVPP